MSPRDPATPAPLLARPAGPATDVVEASAALAAAGLTDMVWGHVSVRDPAGRGVWIKASGIGLEEVSVDDVVLVTSAGDVLEGGGRRHIEFPIHTGVMAARPDVACVVHSHAVAAAAFASLDTPLRALSHDGVLFADPDIPRFTRTGNLIRTGDLGDALAATIGDAPGCLIPQHGMVTVGRTVAEAVMRAVLLERACRTHLLSASAGGPRLWSDTDEVEAKRADVWPAGQLEAGYRYLLRRASHPHAHPRGI
ncbi:L-ribulose-5-phosphate 4-epimerase UlaF (plasmid) [Streptomyces sp. enrichment culture]|uniref:class II aldolase/adducin family protein n=1 Tax=Streptomyces sp. enrichment culture TaxID=1795815 RepID=UPI003F54A576